MAYTNPADPSAIKALFSFPNPVNEVAARLVAAMVVGLSLLTIATGVWWLMIVLAYGFLARVLTGPTLSPMGLFATRVLVPVIGRPPKLVPGPPKRFAQSVGLVLSIAALVLYLATDSMTASRVLLGVLTLFATLESGIGFCAGCFVFNRMMRLGWLPESVCRECRVDGALSLR